MHERWIVYHRQPRQTIGKNLIIDKSKVKPVEGIFKLRIISLRIFLNKHFTLELAQSIYFIIGNNERRTARSNLFI